MKTDGEVFCRDVFDKILKPHDLVFKEFLNGLILMTKMDDQNKVYWLGVQTRLGTGLILLSSEEYTSPFKSLIENQFLKLSRHEKIVANRGRTDIIIANPASSIEELLINVDLLATSSK